MFLWLLNYFSSNQQTTNNKQQPTTKNQEPTIRNVKSGRTVLHTILLRKCVGVSWTVDIVSCLRIA